MGTALLLTETTTVQQHADNSEDNNYGTQRWQNLFIKRPLQDAVKCEGHELEALSRVELVLELHPAEKTEQQNNDWEVLQKNKNKKQTDALRWRLPGCVMLMVAVTSGLHATVCKHTHTHTPAALIILDSVVKAKISKLLLHWKMIRLYF